MAGQNRIECRFHSCRIFALFLLAVWDTTIDSWICSLKKPFEG